MKVRDVMSTNVVSVQPDALVGEVAELLLAHSISAVPVVTDQGDVVGIISEGDLMPRDEAAREARRDWWLQMLSEGEQLHPDYINFMRSDKRKACEMMVSPVVTISEDAELYDVTELLVTNRIKRVPVLRQGKLVGIVSRADLLQSLMKPRHDPTPSFDPGAVLPVASDKLEALMRRNKPATPPPPPSPAIDKGVSASAFHDLTVKHQEEIEEQRKHERQLADERQHREASKLLTTHLTEDRWQLMLGRARDAAKEGEEEYLLVRFPCEICSDHGRAINAPDPEWPTTLRGMPAEIFMRWRTELRPHGFSLQARVVDFPDGIPGDIGLFLSWSGSTVHNH